MVLESINVSTCFCAAAIHLARWSPLEVLISVSWTVMLWSMSSSLICLGVSSVDAVRMNG
eukprot:2399102-Amphidinium_carterae.1